MGTDWHAHTYSINLEQVEKRAYRLWEARGRLLGSEYADWCQARWELEREARSSDATGLSEELEVFARPHPSHEEIAHLAYQMWEARGRPPRSPEADWIRAECELEARAADASEPTRPMAPFGLPMGHDTS
jgi:hypothetical protein